MAPMHTFLGVMLSLLRSTFKCRAALALENAALRQQLGVYLRKQKRPRLRAGDRIFWMALSRWWSGWEGSLAIVTPATVIAWHRRGFRAYWRAKSRAGRVGRPRIPRKHIDFISRISQEHPEWGEDRISEELSAKFGVSHSGSTVRRYMVSRRKGPRGDQTWRTFIKNHAKQVWSCDFVTQYTALFSTVYVLVIMEVGSRRRLKSASQRLLRSTG
jgi:putative transposase